MSTFTFNLGALDMSCDIIQQWGIVLNMVVEDNPWDTDVHWKPFIINLGAPYMYYNVVREWCNENNIQVQPQNTVVHSKVDTKGVFQADFITLIKRCIAKHVQGQYVQRRMIRVLGEYMSKFPSKVPFMDMTTDTIFQRLDSDKGFIAFEGRLFLHRVMRYHIDYQRAANVIIRGCTNWLDKPICKDGLLGVRVRIGLREVCGHDTLVPPID